jgi:hypothetical protein
MRALIRRELEDIDALEKPPSPRTWVAPMTFASVLSLEPSGPSAHASRPGARSGSCRGRISLSSIFACIVITSSTGVCRS